MLSCLYTPDSGFLGSPDSFSQVPFPARCQRPLSVKTGGGERLAAPQNSFDVLFNSWLTCWRRPLVYFSVSFFSLTSFVCQP